MDLMKRWMGKLHTHKAEAQQISSFGASVWEMYTNNGDLSNWFLILGAILLIVDVVFLYKQLTSSTLAREGVMHREGPFAFHLTNIDKLDDVLSDMPIAAWLFFYVSVYNQSMVGGLASFYAFIQILEDAFGVNIVSNIMGRELPTTVPKSTTDETEC